jgi:hypothetical protein
MMTRSVYRAGDVGAGLLSDNRHRQFLPGHRRPALHVHTDATVELALLAAVG